MSEHERDVYLGARLDELDVPDHAPGYWESLMAAVDPELESLRQESGGQDEEKPAVPLPAPRGRRSRSLWTRHPILAIAGGVGIAAVVAAAVLVGLPGVSRLSGPQPVSAAQVIQKAVQALSSGRTIQADSTDREAVGVLPSGDIAYTVARFRVSARSDGSFRKEQIGAMEAPRLAEPFDKRDAQDFAYDAAAGVAREYWRGVVIYEGVARYENVMEVTTGYPLGPPDRWPTLQTDLSVLALQTGPADSRVTPEASSWDGRPVWVISGFKLALSPWGQTYAVTIDQKTYLPVRLQAQDEFLRLEGFTLDWSWANVRIDEPLPDSVFTFAAPGGAKLVHKDAGFRRLPLARMASQTGYVPLLPAWLPTGYAQRWTAAARRSTTANGVTQGRDVVAVQYLRGFDALTVTTRRVAEPHVAAAVDPVEPDWAWAGTVTKQVRLSAGAFAGVTAAVVVAPRTLCPHLYAVKDDVLLTIAGSATAEELIAIAESLQPYGSE